MIKSYIKIGFRNIVKDKVSSIINVCGLAVGMAVAMLIALWVYDEVTFDSYHKNHEQLAQVMSTSFSNKNQGATGRAVAMPLGDELRAKYAVDFQDIAMTSWRQDHILKIGEKSIKGNGIWAESAFPGMFTLKMISGSLKALEDPTSLLLSQSIAKALFGNGEPINRSITVDNKHEFKVAGVYEDLPSNTSFYELNVLLPWKKYVTTEEWLQRAKSNWNDHSFQAYVQLNPNRDINRVNDKVKNLVMDHKNASDQGEEQLLLHPMNKWRLYSDFTNGVATGGRIQFIWLFSIIGFFTLLLACINFMNLSTARSEKRAKEVGIRKAIGSLRSQLIGQFLSESILVALISFLSSIILVLLVLPAFNSLSDKSIELPWSSILFWLLMILFTVFTGLLAGSYPAFYLSGFEPVKVLKGTFKAGKFSALPRKVLVVVQFTFSIALIIGTTVIYKQIQYAKNRPVNYENEGLITLRKSTPDLYGHYDALRGDLLVTGMVSNMGESTSPTTAVASNNIGFNWAGKDPNTLPGFGTIYISEDFGKTIGWQIIQGRDFSHEFATDINGVILNESAVKQITMKDDIIGKEIEYGDKRYKVVGVIKDMIMESPYTPVRPTMFFNDLSATNIITIKIKKGVPVQDALARIADVIKKYNAPFDYTFNDEVYQHKFSEEQKIGDLATFFAVLAIFISCLGLFGFASYIAEQRTKEIGVRKVLGASVFSLWSMLCRDFLLLVLISCAIAIPMSYYFLHDWLQGYEYRTNIPASVFLLAVLGSSIVTLLTISYQTIKAALKNPIKSIRAQ